MGDDVATMMLPNVSLTQHFGRLGEHLGIDLFVQRDDLLPYPFPGNKVRKIAAELHGLDSVPDVLITNGAINSNHCRTTAITAASLGIMSHLVLHGNRKDQGAQSALLMLDDLGASYVVVASDAIKQSVADARQHALHKGYQPHVIPGGCHSPSGAIAYRDAGLLVMQDLRPDTVIVASGTGATQGGLIAAASLLNSRTRVLGVSVARSKERGAQAVAEAAEWAGVQNAEIDFDDTFVGKGYGQFDQQTVEAVALGWRFGLPLDYTYTGKAFAALVAQARQQSDLGRVLFWHTGGLWNYLQQAQGR